MIMAGMGFFFVNQVRFRVYQEQWDHYHHYLQHLNYQLLVIINFIIIRYFCHCQDHHHFYYLTIKSYLGQRASTGQIKQLRCRSQIFLIGKKKSLMPNYIKIIIINVYSTSNTGHKEKPLCGHLTSQKQQLNFSEIKSYCL